MPQPRRVDAVEDEVRQSDWERCVVRLTAVKGRRLELLDLLRAFRLVFEVLVSLREEATGAAARVVDRLPDSGADRTDDGADDLARREELPAVVVLLPHLQQEALEHL